MSLECCRSSSARRIIALLGSRGAPLQLAGSRASNLPRQCVQTTFLPRYSTRICRRRPHVGHSCTKYAELDMRAPPDTSRPSISGTPSYDNRFNRSITPEKDRLKRVKLCCGGNLNGLNGMRRITATLPGASMDPRQYGMFAAIGTGPVEVIPGEKRASPESVDWPV